MANIADVIQQGTQQNAAQAAQLGQSMSDNAQQNRQSLSDTMAVKKFAQDRQRLIDQKGDSLFTVLEFKNNEMNKAKAGWDAQKAANPNFGKQATLSPEEVADLTTDQKRDYEAGTGGFTLAVDETAPEKLARERYEVAISERNQLLDSYIEDPRNAAIIGEYTYDAESKRNLLASPEVLASMTPEQHDIYVGRLTALQQGRRQMGEQAAAAQQAADLQKILTKENASRMVPQGSLSRTSESFSNVGATYKTQMNAFLKGAGDGLKASISDLGSLGPDMKSHYENNPHLAQAEDSSFQQLVDSIVNYDPETTPGYNLNRQDSIIDYLSDNFAHLQDQGEFLASSPYQRLYVTMMRAAEEEKKKMKTRGAESTNFKEKLKALSEAPQSSLSQRPTAEG